MSDHDQIAEHILKAMPKEAIEVSNEFFNAVKIGKGRLENLYYYTDFSKQGSKGNQKSTGTLKSLAS